MGSNSGNGRKDRRRHPRFAEDARVLCVAGAGAGGFQTARLVEVSIDGMRLLADCAFEPGTEIYGGILIPEMTEPLVVLGIVQHCDRDGDGATVGIQFLSVNDEQRAALERLTDYLKRRHGPAATVTIQAAPAVRRISDERWW